MDLPTYTNIWRIEKRLYKLYDFRLPMPLPLGQIAVFTAIAVPYVVGLAVLGLPFSHTLLWLYVLPPGVLAWFATRPVLESKRLPELVASQLRYLGEPRTWCRMEPLTEKDEVVVTARVWRRAGLAVDRVRPAAPVGSEVRLEHEVHVEHEVWADHEAGVDHDILVETEVRVDHEVRLESQVRVEHDLRHGRATRDQRDVETAAWPAVARPARGIGPAAALRPRPAAARPPGPAAHPRSREVRPGRWPALRSAPRILPIPQEPETAQPVRALEPPLPPPEVVRPAPATGWPAPQPPRAAGPPVPQRAAERHVPAAGRPASEVAPHAPVGGRSAPPPSRAAGLPGPQPVRAAGPPVPHPSMRQPAAGRHVPAAGQPIRDVEPPAPQAPDQVPAADPGPPARRPDVPASRPERPMVTVNEDRSAERPVRMVEWALSNPAERRAEGWRDRVVVAPGGHRPGQPDQLHRDRDRARLPVSGTRRVVVLGCTVGAGQTVTTLRTGELLASLRDQPIAVLDLNPGQGSLSELARAMPALTETPRPGPGAGAPAALPSRLEVITNQAAGGPGVDAVHGSPGAVADVTQVFEVLAARYSLTLADPSAAAVPRVLSVADQLVLVAPASAEAASAIAMTIEWLEAHGHGGLAESAITVLNGVSRQTMGHVEQAEAVAVGRCRAIVRVPWDDQLKNLAAQRPAAPGGPEYRPAAQLASASAERAYTALAGVLVASLVAAPQPRRAELVRGRLGGRR